MGGQKTQLAMRMCNQVQVQREGLDAAEPDLEQQQCVQHEREQRHSQGARQPNVRKHQSRSDHVEGKAQQPVQHTMQRQPQAQQADKAKMTNNRNDRGKTHVKQDQEHVARTECNSVQASVGIKTGKVTTVKKDKAASVKAGEPQAREAPSHDSLVDDKGKSGRDSSEGKD